MPAASVEITDLNGNVILHEVCLRFCFQRERYTPYTQLEAVFSAETLTKIQPAAIRFFLNGSALHYGAIDRLRLERAQGQVLLHVSSRGFSAQLLYNQMVPGMLTDVTFSSLMSRYAVPHVSYESGITASNYLWVLPHTSQWEALQNLSYKIAGVPPYISGENCVTLTPKASPALIALSADALLSAGIRNDYTRIISHYHMDDLDGNAEAYSYTNDDATARGIVRHRQLAFDKQYLHNPALALRDKAAFSMRACFAYYASYRGYHGETLGDTMTIAPYLTDPARICKLMIRGEHASVTTTLEAYFDGFCNLPTP